MNSSVINKWWIVALAGVLIYLLALAATAASAEEKGACDEQRWGCFSGGTYGRVQPSWNLRGGPGAAANLVSHGTRLELPPYAEVDFYYRKTVTPAPEPPVQVGAVVTIGFLEDLFHFTGEFEQSFALRNLYGWARGLGNGRVDIWAGSRMVRGDDIYLVDWWPLDNLNTYGGGATFHLDPLDLDLHVGTNRLSDDFQFQELEVTTDTPETASVVYMDRQRTIASIRATVTGHPTGGEWGLKGRLYAEFHGLPPGLLLYDDGVRQEDLPSDLGWVIGGQLGMWDFLPGSHVNLFVRGAGGLGAYGEFAVPFGLDSEKKTTRAREFLVGLSGNVELKQLGIMAGAYIRYFKDADPNVYDLDDQWEGIVVVRPHVYVGRYFQPFCELSYQRQVPNGLSPETHVQEPAGIVKFAVGPSVAFETSTYARPRFHAVYQLSALDDNARKLYDELDPRRDQPLQHYVGIGVEWWINSSSY